MAKLNVSIDTETKEASVSIDGINVEKVRYISISNWSYDGSPSFHFSVETSEMVGDVSKYTTLCANKKETSVASEKYAGLYEEVQPTPQTFSMAKLLEKAKKTGGE